MQASSHDDMPVEVDQLVNELLKKDIELIEAAR